MARVLSNKIESKSRKRKGRHSKKKSSNNKHSKHYKTKYRGQGR